MRLSFQTEKNGIVENYDVYEVREGKRSDYSIMSDEDYYPSAPDGVVAELLVDCWNAVHDGDLGAIAEARAKVRAL